MPPDHSLIRRGGIAARRRRGERHDEPTLPRRRRRDPHAIDPRLQVSQIHAAIDVRGEPRIAVPEDPLKRRTARRRASFARWPAPGLENTERWHVGCASTLELVWRQPCTLTNRFCNRTRVPPTPFGCVNSFSALSHHRSSRTVSLGHPKRKRGVALGTPNESANTRESTPCRAGRRKCTDYSRESAEPASPRFAGLC